MAKFHKHGYHGNVMGKYEIKKNLLKGENMKIKKSLLLSLSLMASLSRAEDDGFYMSVGYQIGEATQMVKNTGALQNLADKYDNLSNLLNQYNYLNSLVKLASTPSAITSAIDNLSSSAINLTSATTTSPAYQAVALALNAAVGMWQVIALFIGCGPGPTNNQSYQSFGNTPALNGTTTHLQSSVWDRSQWYSIH